MATSSRRGPDEVVDVGGVRIHGPTNLAAHVPGDASRMYSRNLETLLDRLATLEDGTHRRRHLLEAAVIVDGKATILEPERCSDWSEA